MFKHPPPPFPPNTNYSQLVFIALVLRIPMQMCRVYCYIFWYHMASIIWWIFFLE